jgi:Tfp pilus assembly protein PilV
MVAIIVLVMAVLMFAAMIAGAGRKTSKEKQIYKQASRHKYEKK